MWEALYDFNFSFPLKSGIGKPVEEIFRVTISLEAILNDSSKDDEKLLIDMSELLVSTSYRLENLSFTQLFKGENDDANASPTIPSYDNP